MKRLTRACAAVAAALTVASCVTSAPGASGADGPPGSGAPRTAGRPALTDPRPCPGQSGATCSDLTVPLDRTGELRGTLKLRVATVGDADAPRGTLLFLTGGPGQPGVPFVGTVRKRLAKALAAYRLVMIDQRGTGGTAVDCPRLQKEVGSSDTVPPSAEAVRECADGLGDLRGRYTTADTVADLEDLRAALGVRQWGAVDGVSYGTYTAGQYARSHPDRTKRLILDSVVPLDGAGALYEESLGRAGPVLRTACAEQSCGYDPAADAADVVRRDGNGTGLFNLLVVASIIDPRLTNGELGILPALHASAQGDPGRLDGLIAQFGGSDGASPAEFSSGLHAATLCADTSWPWGDSAAPPDGRAEALRRAVNAIEPRTVWPFQRETAGAQGLPRTCLPWPVTRPNRAAPARPLTMPVLLLAGDRDLSTPLAWAEAVARRTPSARLVVLKGAGHSTQSRSVAGAREAEKFLLK
ncbi:alpha/beta hydrolase [Streptomyces sp. NPDC050504]|uniref:alpha/beta hydrolase n=1 Tax=Streptomyces sp. NPDC050504 TaxID=3365618 RepID=UPI0037B3019D